MDFQEPVHRRFSVRSSQARPVEEPKLRAVLEAARMAPSASNRQPYRFVVATTAGKEAQLRRAYPHGWVAQAPLLIVACGVPKEAWVRGDGVSYSMVDVAIALDHLILAAAELGLGTCWIAAFDLVTVRRLLELPKEVEPMLLTPLGYPADRPGPKDRRPSV